MAANPNDYENTTRTVQTSIGELEYVGGFPTDDTVRRAYDQLDLQRATQVYLEFIPFMSQQALFDSHDLVMRENRDVGVFDYQARGKVDWVGLTFNTESVYCSATLNVEHGPVVVETPANILGVIDDGWMRYVTDIGNAGPDQGQGGSFLLVHDDYEGELPDGHFVFRTSTYKNWVMARAFVGDSGEGEAALNWYRENFRVYPLAAGPDADADAVYVPFSQHPLDCTHARDVRFFERLAEIVQYEPSGAFTPYQLGLLKALGIEQGRTFEPDARMRALLSEGIEIGDAIAKANAYACRLEGVRVYPDRTYEYLFLGGRHDFMSGDALWLDARLLFHYEAIVVTPAMAFEMVGVGSQYLACYRDANNEFLMGEHTYRLHLPPDIPAAQFWSVTVYHPETRSLLANGEDKPSRSSYDDLRSNEDGSIDLYFGPTPPEGYEQNWVKTLPEQGWQILFRFYGPLETYFDRSWKPDDFVRTD